MSATLYFIDSERNSVAPWECQCVRELSKDSFEASYGAFEECGCIDHDCDMSNANTRTVLSALGFSPDFENSNQGYATALFDACQRYLTSELAEVIDGGTASVRTGNVIDCGRREGYITERVKQIQSLCAQAIAAGAVEFYFC